MSMCLMKPSHSEVFSRWRERGNLPRGRDYMEMKTGLPTDSLRLFMKEGAV